jgi:hypothetical protein
MTKRDFLKLLGMGGAGILATPGVLAAMAARPRVSAVPKLMFDGRYTHAMDYAKRLHKKDIATIDTQGDLVGLWYRDSSAFRLESGQVMLGYTTWSDYQALRILIDDVRLGRDHRLQRQGKPSRLKLLQQNPSQAWPKGLAEYNPSPANRQERIQLVAWLASC